jgi:hypothetical protein
MLCWSWVTPKGSSYTVALPQQDLHFMWLNSPKVVSAVWEVWHKQQQQRHKQQQQHLYGMLIAVQVTSLPGTLPPPPML